METGLIQGILSIVAALIPLIILIVTIFKNRIERTFYPLDSPSLKVLNIKRFPVTHKDWLSITRYVNMRCVILSLIDLLFILSIIFISLSLNSSILTYILSLIITVYAILITYDDFNNPLFILNPLKAKNPVEARHFLFE